MYNNFNYQPYRPANIKCYPVTSIDEVRSAMINFDGSITVFPDLANNKIYTKGTNIDGTAFINTYELTQTPVASDPLETRIAEIEKSIEELKRGLGNEPDGNTKSNEPTKRK